MILYEQPIADLLSVPVYGQGFSCESVMNDEGDQLFGEVEGAVVVGTVGGEDGESVCVVVGANEVVAGRFTG
ncbi:MAG: hypothetical protein RIS92_3244 [Verrucomicrobiota bacterium]